MRISTFGVSVVLTAAVLATGRAESQENTWHSELCPADWTAEFTTPDGRFLHDFSYAGYHLGQEPPGLVRNTFDPVALHQADPTGKTDSQPAIQNTIRAARDVGGGTVVLPAGIFRCDDILKINASNVVLRGEGPGRTRLLFTSVPKRGQRDHILVGGRVRYGDVIPLAADAANRQSYVEVADARAPRLNPGQDVGIGWEITSEFVEEHHMTGIWKVFNGKWRVFFQRTVVRVDTRVTPHRVYLDVPVRYPVKLRHNAGICTMTGYVNECGVESLSVSNAVSWERAWSRAGVHAVGVECARDCWVRDVHSFASPLTEAQAYHLQGGGVYVGRSKRISVLDCRMEKAQNRGGGGAGYLFEISQSSEVLTRDCTAVAGRHNFIQNWDFGASGLVWLRCVSREGRGFSNSRDRRGYLGFSEYHHSLAMACLVDSCTLDDGWFGGNRREWSSGAGNTVTQSVYWNTRGKGVLRSWQAGQGHIIGTGDIKVETSMSNRHAKGTAPEDGVEGMGRADLLRPQSLYEFQLRRRSEGATAK